MGLFKAGSTKVAVVKIRDREKLYSYFMDGDYEVGDDVMVPVRDGGPLTATIKKITSARRWSIKATRTIISKA